MNARVYIDGFNLYYRAVKNTSYKWLDLRKMCELIYPEYSIGLIKYFTARVSARKTDPSKPVRQQIYLRAIRTIPDLEIIVGQYRSRDAFMPLSTPILGNGAIIKVIRKSLRRMGYDNTFLEKRRIVKVIKTEEKGSDVNLATHLLIDGFTGQYHAAIVVSNDSDLVAPILYVRDILGFPVMVLNPDDSTTSKVLARSSSGVRHIRKGVLSISQFPTELTDRKGKFYKPNTW